MAGKREEKKARNRRKLIAATIASIARHGLAETTVSTVVAHSGLSRGMVNLQFDTKKAMLEETLRFLTEEWQTVWSQALDEAGTSPAERLRNSLLVMFEPPIATRKRLAVWHAFWADAHYRAVYASVCGDPDRNYRDTLTRLCRELSASGDSGTDPELASDALSAMLSGLWLDLLTIPGQIPPERAREICLTTLALWFPRHYSAPGEEKRTASDMPPAQDRAQRPARLS